MHAAHNTRKACTYVCNTRTHGGCYFTLMTHYVRHKTGRLYHHSARPSHLQQARPLVHSSRVVAGLVGHEARTHRLCKHGHTISTMDVYLCPLVCSCITHARDQPGKAKSQHGLLLHSEAHCKGMTQREGHVLAELAVPVAPALSLPPCCVVLVTYT